MHRLVGADVTVVEKGPRLIGREDEDVSAAVRGILEAEGVDIRTGVGDIAFARKGDSIVATLDDEVVACSHVLLAVGRVPNTAALGLDKAGVEVDERGYTTVDAGLRPRTPGHRALGACNGRGATPPPAHHHLAHASAPLHRRRP